MEAESLVGQASFDGYSGADRASDSKPVYHKAIMKLQRQALESFKSKIKM